MDNSAEQKSVLRNEWHVFLTAVMFLTRIPVPKNVDHNSGMLQRSTRYFTWVGILVGSIGAGTLYLAAQVLPPALAIAFYMLATIIATGAFHEDGFADCCDAFGGGWTKEKILLIMKDSRLGTYGVIGLAGILGFKYLLLMESAKHMALSQFIVLLIAAHSISRFVAVSIMQQYEYVQDTNTSKSKPVASRKLTMRELSILLAGAILPLAFVQPLLWLAVVPLVPARWYMGRYFNKWIGGYTGDCLGATQQLCEIVFYLSVLIIAPYL